MNKRILSVVLSLALLLSVVSVTGIITPVTAGTATTTAYGSYETFTKTDAGANTTSAANNILCSAQAVSAHLHDGTAAASISGVNMADAMKTKLVDGVYADTKIVFAQDNAAHSQYYLVYDMGATTSITSLAAAGDKSDGFDAVAVYVGNDSLSAVMADDNKFIARYDNTIGGKNGPGEVEAKAVRFNFDEAVSGRYIIFRITGYFVWNKYHVWLSELSATGTPPAVQTFTKANAGASTISTANNILRDAQAVSAHLHDGTEAEKISGVNMADAMKTKLVDGVYADTKIVFAQDNAAHSQYYLVYDMGATANVTSLTAAGDQSDGFGAVAVYVGNDPLSAVMADEDKYIARYDNIIGGKNGPGEVEAKAVRFNFDEAVSGRYIIFRITGYFVWNKYHVWLSELSATGTVSAGTVQTFNKDNAGTNMTSTANNILRDAQAVSAYLHDGTAAASISGVNMADAMKTKLVDGVYADTKIVFAQDNAAHSQYYLVYDMGAAASVTSLTAAGDKSDGFDAVAVYVGNDPLSAVMADDNKFIARYDNIIGGKNGPGEVEAKAVRFNFDEAVSGRYIIFRITGYFVWNKYHVWLSELSATGTVSAGAVQTFNKDNAGTNMTSTADNILRGARTASAYLHDGTAAASISGVNMADAMKTKLVDGVYADTKIVFAQDNAAHSQYYLVYDMGATASITSLTAAGDQSDGFDAVAVYVGNDPLSAVMADEDKYIASYDNTIGGKNGPGEVEAKAVRFNFNEAVSGRYVIFRITGYFVWNKYHVWLSELSATGTVSTGLVQTFNKTNAATNMTSTADNILRSAYAVSAHLHDGAEAEKISGVNMADAMKTKLVDGAYADPKIVFAQDNAAHSQYYFVYDLGAAADITSLTAAGDQADGFGAVAVYVGNDTLSTVMANEDKYIARYDNIIGGKNGPGEVEAKAVRFNFDEAVTGRYVIFRITGYFVWNKYHVWLSELSATGQRNVTPLDNGVNQLNDSNIWSVPTTQNLLKNAVRRQSNMDSGSNSSYLTDGFIHPFNSATANQKTNFFGNNGGTITTVDGKQIQKTDGMATIAFQLDNVATIDKFLVAGSSSDSASYDIENDDSDAKYDNRHVLYYEIYVSDTLASLFRDKNRVIAYNNSADPQLAQIHVLDQAVSATYVGFKVSCGAYSIARLTELGVYGSMQAPTLLGYAGFNNQSQMDTLVNGQKNLILGADVDNKPADYLPHKGTATFKDEQWLSDGFIDWVNPAEGEAKKKVEYNNTNYDKNIYYDLMGKVDMSGVLFSATGVEGVNYRIDRVDIYVSDKEETIFDSNNKLGKVTTSCSHVGFYVDLASLDIEGRYIGFEISADPQYNMVRIAELGVYGTYLSSPSIYPDNLLAGRLPIESYQIKAHGIDNLTAVDVNGHPNSGNTGTVSGKSTLLENAPPEPLSNLTDGDINTRCAKGVSVSPTGDGKPTVLYHDTRWAVFVYQLEGFSHIDEIKLSSYSDPNYYTDGVQYYASATYMDLFKNESLLYTSGGEYYVLDEEKTVEDYFAYLPDQTMGIGNSQHLRYILNEEQRQQEYRYVAVVVTRPYPMYRKDNSSVRVEGYNVFRINEITVSGAMTREVPPIHDTYSVNTSVGKVTVRVGQINPDDRTFFDKTLGGVKVTESKLPDNVDRNINDNWISVDNDTVFTFQLVDKKGKAIPETTNDDITGMNGRELEFILPSTADYVQTMAVLENGALRRLYNSFTDINLDNHIKAGCVDYPEYGENQPNNRDKAILSGTKVSLVYMRPNDIATLNKLNNVLAAETLAEFMSQEDVAGVVAVTNNAAHPLWYILPAMAVVAVAAVIVFLMRRKARRAGQ